ncbi:MAG TPA: CAP domain-containing protein, partial [Polyangiales bacterium]
HRSVAARIRLALLCALGALLSPPSAADADALACRLDDALSQAAADLLLSRAKLDGPQLTAAVRAAGSDALGLHGLFIPSDQKRALETWLADLRARSDSELICGRADSDHGQLVIASPSGGSLAPIDPKSRLVRGSLAKGFDRAELVVAAADGSLTRVGASAAVLARGVAIAPELPAPIQVQLVARGPAGPRPIAERTIAPLASDDGSRVREDGARDSSSSDEVSGSLRAHEVGARDSSGSDEMSGGSPAHTSSLLDRGARASEELAPLVIALRRERGRPALRDNRLLREVASAHADSVCREGRVAHELEQGRGPEARLASAGLAARLVGETIARAVDAVSALRALEQSPSHLLTLLEPRFTDVGVGKASDGRGKSCFVVLLCAWPRYVGH